MKYVEAIRQSQQEFIIIIIVRDLVHFRTCFGQVGHLQLISTMYERPWRKFSIWSKVKRSLILFLHKMLVTCKVCVIEINLEVGGIAAVWDSVFVDLRLSHARYSIISNPITGPERPWRFQEVEAPRFQDNRPPLPPGNIPGTHFC